MISFIIYLRKKDAQCLSACVNMFNTTKMALFTRLEQFFEGLCSLISQARRQLHSDNINILEHFGRRLQDAFDVLNIFKSRCEDVLASTELIISDVISQTDLIALTILC